MSCHLVSIVLIQQPLVYTRTLDHPVINQLQDELKFESFDTIYEKNEDFDSVYQQIVDVLIEKRKHKMLSMPYLDIHV